MKIFIFDKKTTILSVVSFLMVAFLIPVCIYGGLPAFAMQKSLPIYCVETGEKEISVTFDSAWGNEDLDRILQTLKDYNCHATFFVVGDFIDKYPETVKKMYEEGHEIANHSDSHKHYNSLSKEELLDDMAKCDEKIKKITGKDNYIVRSPYGEYNNLVVDTCYESKRYIVQWDCDSLDWKNLPPNEMEERILKRVKNGSILLFHNGAKYTADALPHILNSLTKKGYKFKTVSELIYKDNYKIDNNGMQIKVQ